MFQPVSCIISVYGLGLGFCVRVRVIVNVMGSDSYLNEEFVVFFSLCGAVSRVPGVLTAVCIDYRY